MRTIRSKARLVKRKGQSFLQNGLEIVEERGEA